MHVDVAIDCTYIFSNKIENKKSDIYKFYKII